MSNPVHTSRSLVRRLLPAAIVALLFAALFATVANAAWTTIDTTNGVLDASWGQPLLTDSCGDVVSPGTTQDDISQAWLKYDGTHLYFRIATCDPSKPPLDEGSDRRIAVAINCNASTGNTSFDENGDRKFVLRPDGSVDVRAGDYAQLLSDPFGPEYSEFFNGTVEWRAELFWLPPTCRGSSRDVTVKFGTGQVVLLVVKELDWTSTTTLSHKIDYGDAYDPLVDGECALPSPGTRLQCDGARHGLGSNARLGLAAVDADDGANGTDQTNAYLDDTTGSTPDDEDDGVQPSLDGLWAEGSTPTVNYVVSGVSASPDYLSCWVDWDNDSSWDAGEQLFNDAPIATVGGNASGALTSSVAVPDVFDGINPRTVAARCRLAPQAGQANVPTGPVEFGEVEDYLWAFGASGNRPFNLNSVSASLAAGNSVRVAWADDAANESYRVLRSATDPYFAAASGVQVGAVVSTAPWRQDDSGIVGTGVTRYYMVLGQVAIDGGTLESAKSNRVGLFEFTLTPGG